MPAGRPKGSSFGQDVREQILERLAEGESLDSICKDEGMPSSRLVRMWVLDEPEGFGPDYARARAVGYERLADEIIDLADKARIGVKRTTKADGGIEEVEADMVERSRLQIDARKWMLSKMLPKVYGDKQQVEHTGSVVIQASRVDEDL